MSEDLQKIRRAASLLPAQNERRLVLLTGARQTGKTTLARERYPDLRYVNLDAPENREALSEQPTARWASDVGAAVLDEAQKEPVIFEKVKYAFDARALAFTVLLGSSQVLLHKNVRETLAGRVTLFELFPLLMGELAAAVGTAPEPPLIDRLLRCDTKAAVESALDEQPPVLLADVDGRLRAAENHLLAFGGMPALLPLGDDDRRQWLADYARTYLERDLADLARLDDLTPFRKFQRLVALRSGKLLSYSELARDAGVSVDTARRYLEYLRISYQFVLLQPYSRNLTSRAVKTPKVYSIDPGFQRHLSGYEGPPTGELYETMVAAELIKWIRTERLRVEPTFYRTHSGLEVDFMLESPAGLIALEAKSRERVDRADCRSLRAVRDAAGDEWAAGMVIYRGNRFEPIDDGIWAVPSRRLFGTH